MSEDQFVDEYGFYGPMPISSTHRTIVKEGFPPGIDIGELAPNFELKNQYGQFVDFHKDRAGARAALLFFRSAVW